jgi:spore maturation protein CgeB
VRYPDAVRHRLAVDGIEYGGWLPNFEVPQVFARFRCTVHVPRRAYRRALSGIPTIRMFEALACGIPLITAPWEDCEALFRPGTDYLVANNGEEMRSLLREVLGDAQRAAELSRNGLETIALRHTCRHRVAELLAIVADVRRGATSNAIAPTREALSS